MPRPDMPGTAPPSRAAARRRLDVGARRAVLIVHIVSAGSWFGIDVAMTVVKPWGRIRRVRRACVTGQPVRRRGDAAPVAVSNVGRSGRSGIP